MHPDDKVIITCAVTGAIHTPSMSPFLPVTPEEIAQAAVGAAQAGAAIIHLHARDPETGKPDQTPEAFGRFLPRIKQATDAVVNLTTGGAPYMTVEERIRPAARFKPEVASLNMGSMNFGLFPMLQRFKEFKHDWERKALEDSVTWYSATHSRTSNLCCARWEMPERDLSSNATTPRISITWQTCWNAAWSVRRCSCRPYSEYWAVSARILKTFCT